MNEDALSHYPQRVRDAYARAVQDEDPAAMFEVGEANELIAKSTQTARVWYQRAAESGHVPAVHALARIAAAEGDVEQTKAWLSRLAGSTESHDLVNVAPDVFARPYPEGGWETSPAFLVISPDTETACQVLHRARLRLCLVSDQGREVDEWEQDELVPNYVSDVYLTEAGPVVYLDTKGELTQAMGESMLRILTEELAAAGIAAHVTAPDFSAIGDKHVWTPPAGDAVAEADVADEPEAWFVMRTVWRLTVDGRRYQDLEYRHEDGSWVRDRTLAEQFADPPGDLIARLRAEQNAAGRSDEEIGEVNGMLLPVAPGEPWPMPPSHLRTRG